MKNPFSRRIRQAFIASIFTIALCCVISLFTLNHATKKEQWVQHTYLVIERLESLLSVMKDAETGARGYIITRQPVTLDPYNHASSASSQILDEIQNLTRDNVSQQATLKLLRSNISKQFAILRLYVSETQSGSPMTSDNISEGKRVMDEARNLVKQMKDVEYRLLKGRNRAWQQVWAYMPWFITLMALLGILSCSYFCRNLIVTYFEKVKFRRKVQQQKITIDNRIRVMQALTGQIAAGNYSLQISGYESDTLGILAADINRMTNALDQSFKRLQETMNRKDEFINITAHEFRTPLTSIQATLQLLERIDASDEYFKGIRPLIYRATSQVKRLSTMLKDLLDVSRINNNTLVLNITDFSLKQVIEEGIEEIQAGNISQNITFSYLDDLQVKADRSKILQVFTNLLSNAVKYSFEGSPIQVAMSLTDQGPSVEITDHGKGIPSDKLPFVFDRYFRVEDTSKNHSGLGLGLYISKQIMELHGGTIGADSIVGDKTTFWFTLPAHLLITAYKS